MTSEVVDFHAGVILCSFFFSLLLCAKVELSGFGENRSFFGTGGDISPGASKVVTGCPGGGWVSWPVLVALGARLSA